MPFHIVRRPLKNMNPTSMRINELSDTGLNPFLYVISTGDLYRPDGSYCATGYSGNGNGINNPSMQDASNVGPIPVGLYDLGKVDEEKGPFTIHLSPNISNEMFGRSGFLVHGDNKELNHSASEGCIILERLARIELSSGGGNGKLRVIARPVPTEIVT